MRRLTFISILCAFVAAPAVADSYTDGTVTYGGQINYTQSSYGFGRGGEFTVYDDGGPGLLLSNQAYVSGTTAGLGGHTESFQTFCVETDEYIFSGNKIYVSESFVNGDPGSHAWKGGANTDGGDDLDIRTAYLYYQFATGNLDGYNYGSGGYGDLTRAQTAGALQRVIWALEEEGGGDFSEDFMSTNLNNEQQALATDWFNDADGSGWNDIGSVRILQAVIVDASGNPIGYGQDLLYVVPVPAAVLLGMLGLGAAGLKLRKYV